MDAAQKTTISVPEMTRLLGLKKTEGYWLVHKKQFQTVMIAGQMRIVLSSFEEWYANQTHYKKVDGSAPGSEIKSISYSINDLSKLLNISDDCVYPSSTVRNLVERKGVESLIRNKHGRESPLGSSLPVC